MSDRIHIGEILIAGLAMLALLACAGSFTPEVGVGAADAGGGDGASAVDGGGAVDDAGAPASDAATACAPIGDAELCDLDGIGCGPLATVDNCGDARDIAECGPCAAEHHCELSACVAYVYSWQTGDWGSCTADCGGGTQSRSVWCERDAGVEVAKWYCAGVSPVALRECNTVACCSPSCVSHDACGGDGCGGSCGGCAGDRSCHDDTYCVWEHGNNGDASCHEICFWGDSQCVGTSFESCSTEGVNGITCYCW